MECKVCNENYVRGMGRCFPQIKGCTSVDAWGNCMRCGCTYDALHRFAIEDSMKAYYAQLGEAQMESKDIEVKDLPKEIQQIVTDHISKGESHGEVAVQTAPVSVSA
jgi:hypothetical protein